MNIEWLWWYAPTAVMVLSFGWALFYPVYESAFWGSAFERLCRVGLASFVSLLVWMVALLAK